MVQEYEMKSFYEEEKRFPLWKEQLGRQKVIFFHGIVLL